MNMMRFSDLRAANVARASIPNWVYFPPMDAADLADIVIRADLEAAKRGIDLSNAIAQRFNEVSRANGAKVELYPAEAT